eukprot:1021787-Pleurochrysis_carterae.AAC.2
MPHCREAVLTRAQVGQLSTTSRSLMKAPCSISHCEHALPFWVRAVVLACTQHVEHGNHASASGDSSSSPREFGILGCTLPTRAPSLALVLQEYPLWLNYIVYFMMEIAVIGADIQEVVGSAIALNLLTDGYVPVVVGCIITALDTFTFLAVQYMGVRYLEARAREAGLR